MIETPDFSSIPPPGFAHDTAPKVSDAGFWQRLGYAALGFYCLKGLCWLLIGWYAFGSD